MSNEHRLGAWPLADGTRFCVWSDKASTVEIRWTDERAHTSAELMLGRAPGDPNIFVGFAPEVGPGVLYEVLVDGTRAVDPYARSLPRGVHGAAEVITPVQRANPKRRIELDKGEVFYELHVGTFSRDGTFAAATQRLAELAALGITVVELMPIASFAGGRGWGYDGVALLAPFAPYGTVQELSAFIDAAHGLGLSVVLDVVYNHLGPDGNYLPVFSDGYFERERDNPWGKAPAFEQPAFRTLVLESARYWLEDVGFDGLRIDAAHELEPGGDPHILRGLAEVARASTPPAVLIAEDDRNDPAALFAHGIDAVWSDDLHHSLHVLLTSERDGYYAGYRGDLDEVARVIERGQLYEGQVFPVSGRPRGKPAAGIARYRFIYALQNHDQVGNRAFGERLHALCNLAQLKAITLLWLFLPGTPLLFMGQELAADEPFLYFTDHSGDLGKAITEGRRKEFAHFAAFQAESATEVPDPQAMETFLRSKLRRDSAHAETAFEFHRQALQLRRGDAVLRGSRSVQAGVEGAVLWVLTQNDAGARLLLLNIGDRVTLKRVAGHSAAAAQRLLMSTAPIPQTEAVFDLPAESCSVFALADELPARE